MKPLWPSQLASQGELSFSEFAAELDLAEDQARKVLEVLIDQGWVYPVFIPICPVTGIGVHQYLGVDEAPDPLLCGICGAEHSAEEVEVQIQYRTRPPEDP